MAVVIDIPKALRERLGEEGAAGFVQVLERVVDGTRDDVIQATEERFARRVAESEARLSDKISHEIGQVRSELTSLTASLEVRLTERIERVRSELTSEMASLEARLTRWMFVFWTGQLLALTGILFAFFRK